LLFRELYESEQMVDVAMNSAIGYEPNQVQGRVLFSRILSSNQECGILEELPRADRSVDAGNLLIDNPSCSDVHVAYFGVPHLSFGEPNLFVRGVQDTGLVLLKETIDERFFCTSDRTDLVVSADSETIENNEYDFSKWLSHG
jgi:hypothetical protein